MKSRSLVVLVAGLSACTPSPRSLTPTTAPTSSASTTPLPTASQSSPTLPPALPGDRPLQSLPYTPSLDQSSIDLSASPCSNFYQYTCGGWMKNNPIPADQASWSVYGKLSNENLRFLWGILEQVSQPIATRTPTQQKIGDYFAACMDESAVERRGLLPLKESLDAITAVASVRDLAPVIGHLRLSNNHQALFRFGSEQDFQNSSQMIAVASAGGLGLPDRDYYTKTDAKSQELRQKYLSHVQRMLQLLGDSPADAAREAASIMSIETALAKASLTKVDKRNPYNLFHRMTVDRFVAIAPSFDWAAFFSAVGGPSMTSLNVAEPAFYKELEKQLKTVPLSDWKTYLRWHLVHSKAPYLSSAVVQENFDFFRHTLRGVPTQPPRWKRCVAWVDDQLGEALGEEFVRRTFTPDTKQRAVDMTRQIELAMEADLQNLAWMGPATKKQALAKLHAIANKIGYPDHYRDYSAVVVDRTDFALSVEHAEVFEARRWINKIGKPVDRSEWFMTPPTVNAYYDAQMNDINFPAGVLQPPLFDIKLDDAPNYGNTGATIGHELTHGFDDEGRQFDAKGNLKDWWTKQDAAAFNSRANCVVEQYAQYTIVDEIKINSKLTEGEDVADLGGTMLAYVAWKQVAKQNGVDFSKPIDGFTPEQRFFVGMAQWACENDRPENLRASALTNPHSPGIYRINGVVSNMPEFQAAFSCKAGQPMVRDRPCRVW